MPLIAVTGASGKLGRRVLAHLAGRTDVAALSRTPDAVRGLLGAGGVARRVDFADAASLRSAFEGVERLLLISTSDMTSGQRADHQGAAVAAAVAAGVRRIVYTSFVGADAASPDPVRREHGLTELALARSGVAWTALRNNGYADALPVLFQMVTRGGRILIPAGDARTSWVTRDDCARAAAAALVADTALPGALDVTGPDALTLAECAHRIAARSGLAVAVVADDELMRELAGNGLPEPMAERIAAMVAAIAREGCATVSDAVARLTGVPASPIEAALV